MERNEQSLADDGRPEVFFAPAMAAGSRAEALYERNKRMQAALEQSAAESHSVEHNPSKAGE